MPEPLTPHAFSRLAGVDDWRVTLGRIEAVYRAASFSDAGTLVGQIAAAADAADHHPDVDLRYPGLVHVTLTTHSTGGLSDLDADLARTISGLAAAVGASAETAAGQVTEIAIDAIDIPAVLPFWRAVLGYVDDGERAIRDPRGFGPPVWFQQMDAPRPQRNRVHVDVTVAHDRAEERIAAAVAAGGTVVTDRHARAFWVLADAEGNEACVCTWQDRPGSGQ